MELRRQGGPPLEQLGTTEGGHGLNIALCGHNCFIANPGAQSSSQILPGWF
jgi:hypothetical protein